MWRSSATFRGTGSDSSLSSYALYASKASVSSTEKRMFFSWMSGDRVPDENTVCVREGERTSVDNLRVSVQIVKRNEDVLYDNLHQPLGEFPIRAIMAEGPDRFRHGLKHETLESLQRPVTRGSKLELVERGPDIMPPVVLCPGKVVEILECCKLTSDWVRLS